MLVTSCDVVRYLLRSHTKLGCTRLFIISLNNRLWFEVMKKNHNDPRQRGGFMFGLLLGGVLGSLISTITVLNLVRLHPFVAQWRKEQNLYKKAITSSHYHEKKNNKTEIQLLQSYPYYDYYLDEIMPTSLKQLYAQDKLAFPITPSMLRRTRPIIGNNQRLHMYLDKLHRKQCTTVVFMGGSVTRGEKLDIIYIIEK